MRRTVPSDSIDQPGRSSLRFRRLRTEDLPRIMQIEDASFAHPWSLDLLQKELSHDWSTVLLATELRIEKEEEREVILGFVIYWQVHDEAHILNVAVAEEERRRGIGRALMQEAHQRSRKLGAVLATLEVRRSNEGAIELYRSMGYRQVGIRSNYYADEGEDAVVMVLDL